MSDGLVNIYTVFVLGMSGTWLVFEIIRILPFDDYFKILLAVILPLPLVLMGLVMMNYGPASYRAFAVAECAPGTLIKSLFSGAFWGFLALSLVHLFLSMREEE